jgi:protein TonB
VRRALSIDDPWSRLSWVGPTSVLLVCVGLYGFLRLTLDHAPPPPVPRPVSVSVVTLLPAPATALPQVAPPVAVQPPKSEPAPEIEKPLPQPAPRATVPQPAPRTIVPKAKAVETPPQTPPPIAAQPQASNPTPSGGTVSARAIYKPMPEIPDELRHQNVDLIAVARFQVHADGKAEFELLQATPVPALNSALLDKLKTWRFFPAMENGKPIESTIDLRIPITVH